MKRKKNISKFPLVEGKTFGRWSVIRHAGVDRYNNALALCECKCGKVRPVMVASLLKKLSQSCGCLKSVHGMSGTPEHSAWRSMNQRCTNPKNKRYDNYGGRGITVCPAWRKSFLAFFKDMGTRPTGCHSIDRINNDGGYSKKNCRWALPQTQMRNRSNSLLIKANGCELTVAEWSRRMGIKRSTLVNRIRLGWKAGDIIKTYPVERKRKLP